MNPHLSNIVCSNKYSKEETYWQYTETIQPAKYVYFLCNNWTLVGNSNLNSYIIFSSSFVR